MAAPTAPLDTPLLHGALLSIDTENKLNTKIVPFQYNPEQLSRSLKPQAYSKAARTYTRFTGAPSQTIDMTVKVEAVGDMASNAIGSSLGVYPHLAALETLIYPSSQQFQQYRTDVESAKLWAVPPKVPRPYFVWGPGRVWPVDIKSLSIKETLFNSTVLAPIAAEVGLSLELVPLQDAEGKEFQVLLAQLKALEALGKAYTAKRALAMAKDMASMASAATGSLSSMAGSLGSLAGSLSPF